MLFSQRLLLLDVALGDNDYSASHRSSSLLIVQERVPVQAWLCEAEEDVLGQLDLRNQPRNSVIVSGA